MLTVMRNTSLKTSKSPPTLPRRKKIVRFADTLGLDLAAVKTIMQEDLPLVPDSAFDHLTATTMAPKSAFDHFTVPTMAPWMSFPKSRSTLIPEFVEPFVQMSFVEKVKSQSICLENCYINPSTTRLACVGVTNSIRVLNRCYEKSVLCRYTCDNWSSFTDVRATFVSSPDSWSDRFTVTFNIDNLTAGQRVQFALRYIAGSEEFWDNNSGANYSLMYRI